jgi:hypothetical protein
MPRGQVPATKMANHAAITTTTAAMPGKNSTMECGIASSYLIGSSHRVSSRAAAAR